ncbi:MAG: PorT family protein [Bacteroidales bacterium]|nr:PorT family protein [Bacteroidales bacterium]
MKKRKNLKLALLTLATAFAFGSVGWSQAGELSYGVKVGASFSGFTHNMDVYTQYKTGFAAGAVVNYNALAIVGVGLEVNFQQSGAFHTTPFDVYPSSALGGTDIDKVTSDVTMNALNIPLLINFAPLSGNDISPRIVVGFALDYYFNVTSRDLLELDGSFDLPLESRSYSNVTNNYQSINYGPLAGFGLDMNTASFTYFIEGRYQVGLNNVSNLGTLRTSNGRWEYSVNTITIAAGIKLK